MDLEHYAAWWVTPLVGSPSFIGVPLFQSGRLILLVVSVSRDYMRHFPCYGFPCAF